MIFPQSPRASNSIQKRTVFLSLATAAMFLYLRTFALGGTPLIASQDGPLYFEHGIRILHGQVPFRDYFTYVMPGTDLLYAGVFGLFGVHAWLAQAIVIILGTAIAGLLLWLSSKILRGPQIFLPALLFLVLDFDVIKDATHHWYCTLLVLVAVGVLLDGKTTGRVASAGALCGLGALFTQSQGLLCLLAIGAYLVWTRERESRLTIQLAALFLPFAIIVGGVLTYYIHRVGFASVYFALVTFVIHYFPAMTFHTPRIYFESFPPHHKLMDLSRLIPYFFIHIMVPFGYLWCLFRLFLERHAIDRMTRDALLLINFVGIALFAAVAQAASYARMGMIAPPAAIVCVWLVSGMSVPSRWIRRALWATALLFLVLLPLQLQRHWRGYLDLPTGRTAFLSQDELERLQWFAGHTRAGESFIGPPAYTFALALDNPTTVDYLTDTEYTTKDQVAIAIQNAEMQQTPMIVLADFAPATQNFATHPGHGNLAPFVDYVHTNYHLTKVFKVNESWNDDIWERNGSSD